MTTERQADLVIKHLQAWANGFREAAQLNRYAIGDGDPTGIGVERLRGRADAYEDAARALQDHVDRIQNPAPKLEIVS